VSNDKLAATFHGVDIPFGTPVTYWPGVREGAGIESVTRSGVWFVCGQPVVLVEGYSGGVALTHIEPRVEVEEKPDLTPEQDLRAAVADILSDVEHFTGCHRYVEGDGRCTCLVGRLEWAINAEQVTEPRQDGAA
jgi:hypothetical protein